MDKVRVGIVGTGAKGRQHMGILASFPDVELAALCDPLEKAREEKGAEFGIERRYADIPAFLDDAAEVLDAVFVATPPDLNAPSALLCLQRGLHTFMEKPPGMSAAETAGLRDAAAVAGVLGMVGWNRRFHSMVREARRLVGERGPIVQLVGEFHKSLTRFEQRGLYSDQFLDNMMWESINHSVYLEGINKGVVFCDGERFELAQGSSGTEEEDRYFIDRVKDGGAIEAPACSLGEAVKTMELGEGILAGLRE